MIALLSGTRIAETLPARGTFDPVYWVAGRAANGASILKAAVYNSTGDVPVTVTFDGVRAGTRANLTVLTAPDANSYADIGSDPVKTSITQITAGSNGAFVFSLPDLSVAVLETENGNGAQGYGAPAGYGGRYGGGRGYGHGHGNGRKYEA